METTDACNENIQLDEPDATHNIDNPCRLDNSYKSEAKSKY